MTPSHIWRVAQGTLLGVTPSHIWRVTQGTLLGVTLSHMWRVAQGTQHRVASFCINMLLKIKLTILYRDITINLELNTWEQRIPNYWLYVSHDDIDFWDWASSFKNSTLKNGLYDICQRSEPKGIALTPVTCPLREGWGDNILFVSLMFKSFHRQNYLWIANTVLWGFPDCNREVGEEECTL